MVVTRQSLTRPALLHRGYLSAHGVSGWFNPEVRRARLLKAALTVGTAAYAGVSSYVWAKLARTAAFREEKRANNSTMAYRRRSKYAMKRLRRRRAPARRMKRFSKKVLGKRRGTRYTGARKNMGKKLNINFTRNDVRSLRVQKLISGTLAIQEGSLLFNNTRYTLALSHWVSEWDDEISRYTEYRFTDCQFVLRPRNISTSSMTVQVTTGHVPYFALRTVNPIGPLVQLISQQKMQQTPGVRYIPLLRKARTIQNVIPSYTQRITALDGGGNPTVALTQHKAMPWITIGSTANLIEFAAIEITRPEVQVLRDGSNTARSLDYDVEVYATLHLRGNKDQLIAPYKIV